MRKLILDVAGAGSGTFATISERVGSGGGDTGQRDVTLQPVVVPTPEYLPDNDYMDATDPADDVFESLASLQKDFRDVNAKFPSTIIRALGVLSDLVQNPPRDYTAVPWVNSELKEEVEKHHKA